MCGRFPSSLPISSQLQWFVLEGHSEVRWGGEGKGHSDPKRCRISAKVMQPAPEVHKGCKWGNPKSCTEYLGRALTLRIQSVQEA